MKTKLLLFTSTIILLVSIALAAHTITPTSYSTNETIQTTFNITVANTDAGQLSNITSVNITIPSTFTFTATTNGSNATASVFSNTSTVLSWTNTTGYIVNGTETMLFWFNATATPGNYNITVTTTNITGSYSSNISVEVNDTTPTASFGTNPINTYNSSSPNVTFDYKCSDRLGTDTIVLWGNWSGSWIANNTNTSTINNTYSNVSITNLADGTYKWAVYCNNTAGNGNWSTTNRTLIIDTTDPTATGTCSPTSIAAGGTVTCTCSGTDATSGVSTTSTNTTPDTSAQLGDITYTCTVTDYAGNSAEDSVVYTVTGDSDGGTSSGTTSSTFWTTTYTVTAAQLTDSFTREISAKQRLRVTINSTTHYVGLIELSTTTATINVTSDPQQAIMKVGDERKFEVTNDTQYDIIVTLNSITNTTANITVQSINETVTEESVTEQQTLEEAGAQAKTEGDETSDNKGWRPPTWLIITIIILVVIAALMIIFIRLNKRRIAVVSTQSFSTKSI